MLHGLQFFFFFNKTNFFLFQRRFFRAISASSFMRLSVSVFVLLVQVFVSDIKTFQCCFGQLNA